MRTDFNGDGRDDILWRNGHGSLSNWLADADGGFTNNDPNALVTVAPTWRVVATGDFNGDHRADILWQHGPLPSDGPGDAVQFSNWLGTQAGGFTVNDANAFFTIVPPIWAPAGTGDFNGDGRDDILWRSLDGTHSNWLGTDTGGFIINDTNALVHVPIDWTVAGTGDFDGDGNADILWRNNNGLLSNWLGTDTGGFFINDAVALTPWVGSVAGIGDFDGNGRDDILGRTATGELFVTPAGLGGSFDNLITSRFVASVPVDWHVAAVGDYNGDGTDDILWRNDNGALSNWLGIESQGFRFTVNDANAFAMVSTDWLVQPFIPTVDSGAGSWDY
jgi:hypothetical protein